MDKHLFDASDSEFDSHSADAFASETELLRGANLLPKLPSQLRERVLNAASAGYRQARRWARARQAASLLSVCLIASVVLSPLAKMEWPHPTEFAGHFRHWHSTISLTQSGVLEEKGSQPTPASTASVWMLSHDATFLDLPAKSPSKPRTRQLTTIARADSEFPRDELVATFQSSDGWAAVQAFEAVRSRSRNTIQRALAAN